MATPRLRYCFILTVLAFSMVALSAAVSAQPAVIDTLSTEADGVVNGLALLDNFGRSVAVLKDIDGDGCDEIIVGAPFDDRGGFDSGAVTVFSGRTGEVIHDFLGPLQEAEFGITVADAGDADGDGVNDILVGAHFWDEPGGANDTGAVYLYSGATGEELWMFPNPSGFPNRLGDSVSGLGDIDGDGCSDVVAGSIARVFVISGKTGLELHSELLAAFVKTAAVGDVDGDGTPDYAAGICRSDIAGTNNGEVRVFSGADHSLIWQLADADTDALGTSLAGADVNGDGFSDIIAGAKFDVGPAGNLAGRVVVFDGRTGQTIHQLNGEVGGPPGCPGDEFGISVANAGDVNGDGGDDFLVGAWRFDFDSASNGRVYLYSGKSGVLLQTFTGTAAARALGVDVAAGDINGDGAPDVLAGASGDQFVDFGAGRAYVFLSCPGDLTGDQRVNAADLAILLATWGPARGLSADLNGDGFVNASDLATLLARWGACGFGPQSMWQQP